MSGYPLLPHWKKCWGCGLNHEPSDHSIDHEPDPEPEPERPQDSIDVDEATS